MPYDPREFETNDIDLAAFLSAHGRKPGVCQDKGRQLALFVFRRDDALLGLIEAYSTGEAIVSAKALLGCRRRLFHDVRRLEVAR